MLSYHSCVPRCARVRRPRLLVESLETRDVPAVVLLSPVPIATAWLALWVWRVIDRRSELLPFLGAIALFTMGYIGLAISLWPNIVPHSISLWDAAAAPRSQAFLLLGTLFLLPVIVAYTAWSYWVFRGKVRAGTGYH